MNQLNKLSQAEAKSDHKVLAVAVDEEDEIENVLLYYNSINKTPYVCVRTMLFPAKVGCTSRDC